MRFVVYVNHPTSKARVHRASCQKYLSRKADRTLNGYWKTSFPDFESARKYAQSTGKKNVDSCGFCC